MKSKEDIARIQKYVSENLDTAIANDYIKVYYQPVVRTLSGALCGLEALARWDDPGLGLLAPYLFIEPLEQTRQIYKLDQYIIRKVCENIKNQYNSGRKIVPVSFNLSRLDFISCDIFKYIEKCVEEFDVPKDMVHVEITESMLVGEGSVMQHEIKLFHDAGYQVWMDDFGSGYSSLNVLKDYKFDELKIDMEFLSSFSKVSKDIITSIVDMSKKIGIQTLAEGVETAAQFQFLKEIGCEKAQGYFFSKPLPYQECLDKCAKEGLTTETRKIKNYYDRIGKENFLSDSPVAIVHDDGKNFKYLFANKAYMRILNSIGVFDLKTGDHELNSYSSPLRSLMRNFIEKTVNSGLEEIMYYTDKGNYLILKAKTIAGEKNDYYHRLGLQNITVNKSAEERKKLDEVLRSLYVVYKNIYVLDLDTDTYEDVKYAVSSGNSVIDHVKDVRGFVKKFGKDNIYYEDRARFEKLLDRSFVKEKIEKSGKGYFSIFLRVRDQKSGFKWHAFYIISVDGNYGHKVIVCEKEAEINDTHNMEVIRQSRMFTDKDVKISRKMSGDDIFRSLMSDTDIKFYWKDINRKFVGVSDSFLDYYGFKSPEELIGKTDEEVGFHINDDQYRDEEYSVLKEGKKYKNLPGKCIARGRVRDIYASKLPVYSKGNIAGLVGYFIDLENCSKATGLCSEMLDTDQITGVMNVRGLLGSMYDYAEQYELKKKKYAFIYIKTPEFKRIYDAYGARIGRKLLELIACAIKSVTDKDSTIGRIVNGDFLVIRRYRYESEIGDIELKLRMAIMDIHEVEGFGVTLIPQINVVFTPETGSFSKFINKVLTKEL